MSRLAISDQNRVFLNFSTDIIANINLQLRINGRPVL